MITLTPAFGRDFKSKKAVQEHWDANLDFLIADISNRWDGKPVNKSQLVGLEKKAQIRFSGLRKVCILTV
ncbi:hypothetical protein KAR91_23710 [Candidatus Pacearchaeota archaeon]|nr:hypothetical protein [Candidatus Pacearchaeota archaeon]